MDQSRVATRLKKTLGGEDGGSERGVRRLSSGHGSRGSWTPRRCGSKASGDAPRSLACSHRVFNDARLAAWLWCDLHCCGAIVSLPGRCASDRSSRAPRGGGIGHVGLCAPRTVRRVVAQSPSVVRQVLVSSRIRRGCLACVCRRREVAVTAADRRYPPTLAVTLPGNGSPGGAAPSTRP